MTASPVLRIGQLTDLHIGFDRTSAREANLIRLEAALALLNEPGLQPDLILLTGDLTEHGDGPSFDQLAAALAGCGVPVWPIPGNHDSRAALLHAFPHVVTTDDFVHYTLDLPGLRVLMLDTLDPGRHGGAFCDRRARWLAERLGEAPDTPTLIAMHHPPFAAGIAWMDTHPDEPWVARFGAAIAGHGQIVGIVCGHVHQATTTRWRGVPALIAGSTAPAVALDLRPIDADAPDGRALIAGTAPGLALHCWDGTALISHLFTASPAPALASHDGRMTALLRAMAAERP